MAGIKKQLTHKTILGLLLALIAYPAFAHRATNSDIYGGGFNEPVAPAAIYALWFIVAALIIGAGAEKEMRPIALYLTSPLIAAEIVAHLFGNRLSIIVFVGLFLFFIFWKMEVSEAEVNCCTIKA